MILCEDLLSLPFHCEETMLDAECEDGDGEERGGLGQDPPLRDDPNAEQVL